VDTVLSKEALFPDLLDKIKYYLKESEPAEQVVELRERA
jgi:hypothetical protein